MFNFTFHAEKNFDAIDKKMLLYLSIGIESSQAYFNL